MEGYVKRSGADGSGRDYEIKMTALLALRCALRKDSQDVWLGSNLDQVGNFDDVVLFKRSLDGTVDAYLMQLKHQDSPKNIKQKEFTSNAKGASKDFNLTKYYEEYVKLGGRIEQSQEDETLIVKDLRKTRKVYYVLYTNRGANACDFLEETFDESLRFLNTSVKDSVYKFKGLSDYSDSFLDDLYLFVDQTHLNQTERLMINEIKSVMGKDFFNNEDMNSFVERYCAFVRTWGNDRSVCQPLNKTDVLNQIVDSLLSSFKVNFSKDFYTCYSNPNKLIWNDLVSQKLVTVVDFSAEIVSFLKAYVGSELKDYCSSRAVRSWTDIVKDGLQLLSARNVRVIDPRNNVTLLDVYRYLWFENRVPLLLQVETADDYKNVYRILKLAGFAVRVIIVAKNFVTSTVKPGQEAYLTCLADLESVHLNRVLRIPVKLQGRGPIPLTDLIDKSMYGLVTVGNVVEILSGTYSIGGRHRELPEFFIERFLPKVLIKLKALDEIPNDFFLIETELTLSPRKNALMVRGREEALQNLPKLKEEHAALHWVKYDRNLEWLQSFGGAASLDRYQYSLPVCTKSVDEVHSTVNIVSASPGMGKSVLLDYVARNAPISKWVLRINLAEFEDKPLDSILESAHEGSELTRKVFEKYRQRRDLVVLLDGFDEVSINQQEPVLAFAERLVDKGFAMWMTTRAFMKNTLEMVFGTFAVTLVPFTVDDQRSFLVKYFGQIDDEPDHREILREFVDKLLVAAQKNLHDWDYEFTGIPLQTKLLADVFYADCQNSCASGVASFNENFDLIYLYDEFVKKKLDIMMKKFGRTAVDMRVLFEHQQKLFALRTVFPKVYLQALDVERQLEEFSRNDRYKMQFMQREGIVVIESGVVKFVHRTFAEYLAAQWLSENSTNKDLMQLRFLNQYTFLFNLFDRIVSRNNELNTAVINLETAEALRIIETKPEAVRAVDACGRNVVHMIALYGTHHKPYQHLETVTDPLVDVLRSLKAIKELARSPDKTLSYSPLDYAVAAWSLSIADCLSQHHPTINAEIDHYRKDAYFAHCATLGYSSLFRVLLTYFSAREILFIRNTAEDTLVSQFFSSSNIGPTDHDKILLMAEGTYERPLLDLFKRGYLDEEVELPGYYYDLRFASGYGTPDNVQYLLDKGADVDHQDIDKNTCLHYACINGQLENVRVLLENDAQVNLLNANNNSPLHYAIRRNHSDIAELLLENGANPNFQNRNKFTVLHFALTCASKKKLVELMIKSGADPNLQNNKLNTALHYAAQMGYGDVLLNMIRRGGDVNKTNYNDESPLFLAMRSGHSDVALTLLKKGASVHLRNKNRQSVLNVAAELGYEELVLKFLDRGADVNNVDIDNDSPLNDALMNNHFGIAKMLLENGADGGIRNNDGYCALHYIAVADSDLLEEAMKSVDVNTKTTADDTPLHLALSKNKVGNALSLLSHGVDVDVVNRAGNSPLHIAAFLGNVDIVREILKKCVNCDRPNVYGDTPFHLALKKRQIACANLLLPRCDINKSSEDGTALHYAVKKCTIEIVKFLIENGVKIDARNCDGKTPLHVAVTDMLHDSNPIIEECLVVIKLLLENGADANSKDDLGNTPLHYISRLSSVFLSEEVRHSTCKKVAQMLIEKGADVKILNNEGEGAISKRQRHNSCVIS